MIMLFGKSKNRSEFGKRNTYLEWCHFGRIILLIDKIQHFGVAYVFGKVEIGYQMSYCPWWILQ